MTIGKAEARAKVPSKAERAAQEAAQRDAALMTNTLDPSNKGFQLMAKLGFKPGEGLGKQSPAGQDPGGNADTGQKRTEPLNLIFKEDRGGIGLDSEKKRKIREEANEAVKKIKQEEGDYRDRVRVERETKRTEAQVHAAQKVAERLDVEADENYTDQEGNESEKAEKTGGRKTAKPTSQIPVLYRGLVREREEKERDLYARHHLQTSLPSSFFPNPRLPGYDDTTLEQEDREALDHPQQRSPSSSSSPPPHEDHHQSRLNVFEEEVGEEDPELDEFNALEPPERLHRLVMYLRERHWYCFWCKYRYDTREMEGCPGITEEDHD